MSVEAVSFRIAVVQMAPEYANPEANRVAIANLLSEAANKGAALVLFPECAISGYVFDSAEEAYPACETIPGATTQMLETLCAERNIYAVVGLLERDGDAIYNVAVVVGPQGFIAKYRKCHLPVLGVDRYVAKGDCLEMIDLGFVRVGILICYDIRFPEAARNLALQGADVLLVPTNWPQGAESAPEFMTRTRAWENRFYVAACNRVGVEQGVRFIGRSQIVTPDGEIIQQADGETSTILYAEIYPERARQKKLIREPGVWEFDPVGDRRPELYGRLV